MVEIGKEKIYLVQVLLLDEIQIVKNILCLYNVLT